MADVKVRIGGDASGAKEAFDEAGHGAEGFGTKVGEAIETVHLLVEGLEKGLEKAVEFGKECVEAFFESEKAVKQLERAAGDNAEAFRQQASVMQDQLGVSDELVMQIDKMLLTFGEAPSQIDATTRAILDYAAYSGTDAVSATHALLSATQSGKTAFKELGLEYEKTGEASSTLANVTAALAAKIGGTAQEEANTLEGSIKKAHEQLGEFKEGLGALIAEFVSDTTVVEYFTGLMKDLQLALRVETGHGRGIAEIGVELEKANATLERYKIGWFYSTEDVAKQTKEVERLQAELGKAGIAQARLSMGLTSEGPSDEGHQDRTVKGKLKEKQVDFETYAQAMAKSEAERVKEQEKNLAQLAKDRDDAHVKDLQAEDKDLADEEAHYDKKRKQLDLENKWELDDQEKQQKESLALLKKQQAEFEQHTKQFNEQMKEAGWRLGTSFVNELNTALQQATSGGEVDTGQIVANLIEGLVGLIASMVATYFGGPAAGQFVGAVTALGSTAINSQVFKKQPVGKKHEGGWIEPKRFHDGGWPGGLGSDEQTIIAQRDERVLSRPEVNRMGGRSAVDSAARGGGGGGTQITIVAQDSQSMLQMLQGRMGRAFVNAIRTGQGQLVPLFEG